MFLLRSSSLFPLYFMCFLAHSRRLVKKRFDPVCASGDGKMHQQTAIFIASLLDKDLTKSFFLPGNCGSIYTYCELVNTYLGYLLFISFPFFFVAPLSAAEY